METPRNHPNNLCPFEKLSDELLVEILERSCDYHALTGEWNTLPEVHQGTWVAARELAQLNAVCRLFRRLHLEGNFKQVVWDCNQAELVGAHAVAQTAEKTRGVVLDFGLGFIHEGTSVRETHRDENVSIELLSGVLGKAIGLKAFVLRDSQKQQTSKASQHLLGLLARLPLESLWFIDTGFDFMESMSGGVLFKQLQDCRLESLQISDTFLSSLLAHSPMLKSLQLRTCKGLNEPNIKSLTLETLSLTEVGIPSKRMTIDAPRLSTLESLPDLETFVLRTPKLKTLRIQPIGHIDTLDCGVSLSHLYLRGSNWRTQQVQHLLNRFGASEELSICVRNWQGESAPVCVSAFFEKVPSTISTLYLGDAMEHFRWSEECGEKLSKLRFDVLKRFSLSLKETGDFDLIRLVLQASPNLEHVRVSLRELEKPIEEPISQVLGLQRDFPRTRFKYMEPNEFVSGAHLDYAARESPEMLATLLDDVKGSGLSLRY